MRIEKDSHGEVEVPKTAHWGAQTQRSRINFNIGQNLMPLEIIQALIVIKSAAAQANCELGQLDQSTCNTIVEICSEISELLKVANAHTNSTDLVANDFQADSHNVFTQYFPLKVWQTGSGTQTNMNVNEVIANLARKRGIELHPNDHVNLSQSSNDTFSSALHIATYRAWIDQLAPVLAKVQQQLDKLVQQYKDVVKIGRTHFMDAVPLTVGDEISAWRDAIGQGWVRIDDAADRLQFLSIGGTAVGTGLNAHRDFGATVCRILGFRKDSNAYYQLAGKDSIAHFHSCVKDLAMSLLKISNDIRFLASGPRAGIAELTLPTNEPGSSIMPGKVNPTQCESLAMVCLEVFGNDSTVSLSAASGNLQLNVYMPVIGFKVLESVNLLADVLQSFNANLLSGLRPNEDNIKRNLNNSLMLCTALNPLIGYERAAEIAKIAYSTGRTLREVALEQTDLTADVLDTALDPHQMLNHPNSEQQLSE